MSFEQPASLEQRAAPKAAIDGTGRALRDWWKDEPAAPIPERLLYLLAQLEQPSRSTEGNHKMAPKSKRAESGRRRLGTRKEQLVAVRLSTERIKQIDAWAKGAGAASRAEAIRRLVNQSLVAAAQQPRRGSHKGASKATELASEEIDRRVDHSLPVEERERRKRQLTKGPQEFRDLRGDLPKPKV